MGLKMIFDFLLDLKFNNYRGWFKENHDRYQTAKSEFEHFIDKLIPGLKQIDTGIDNVSAKECIFRVYRDVRFSKNKEPYKTHFGAFIAKGGRKSVNAGYYIHFEPDNSIIGGGIYAPGPALLKAIRTKIFKDPAVYKSIIHNNRFKKYFPEMYGERLKSAPKGFPKDFSDIDLLKNKHFVVDHKVKNSFWFENKVEDNILDIFKMQYPLNRFLNDAIMH